MTGRITDERREYLNAQSAFRRAFKEAYKVIPCIMSNLSAQTRVTFCAEDFSKVPSQKGYNELLEWINSFASLDDTGQKATLIAAMDRLLAANSTTKDK